MPHTRSQGEREYSPFTDPEFELHERQQHFRERLKEVLNSRHIDISPVRKFEMGDNVPPRRTIHQQASEGIFGAHSPIAHGALTNTNTWQIPSHVMSTISNVTQFHGLEDEDAQSHLSRFTRICNTFNIANVTVDAIYLRLFPFTLQGRALTWFESQPHDSITTWEQLSDKFLSKYYPPSKAARLRNQIHSFKMDPDEAYYMAYERFQNMLAKCPNHGLTSWALVEKFFNGLTPAKQVMFNTSAGGHVMEKKTREECDDLFLSFALTDQQSSSAARSTSQNTTGTRGMYHVKSSEGDSDPQVMAVLASLAKEMKEIKMGMNKCELCRGNHDTSVCPTMEQEQVDFVGNNRNSNSGYGNTYNQNWKNHPNFGWRSGGNGNPPGFQPRTEMNQDQSSGGGNDTKEIKDILATQTQLLTQLISKDQETQNRLREHDTILKSQQSAFLDLQRVVGDMAKRMEERPMGSFSGGTEMNPKATLKAVTTRSGKGGEKEQPPVEEEEPVDEEIEMESPGRAEEQKDSTTEVPGEKVQGKKDKETKKAPVDLRHVPYPARLMQDKYVKEFGSFLEMFKQLKINLPFIEAIQHMPKYAKFLKDLLSNRKKLESLSNVELNERCSAVIQNNLPEKLEDPGIFTIPCLFGGSSACFS